MTRVTRFLVEVRDSFWFFASVCTVVAIVAVEGLVAFDRTFPVGEWGAGGLLLQVGAEGSRSLLAAITTSMLAAAATTFSITVAVLALTSSSYGPRLVRNFLADRGNQFVLGFLVGTAVYSLLVLRHVRVLDLDSDDDAFVPHLSVNVAVLLAIAGIGALVYFIHHISVAIQVSTLSTRVREDLLGLVDELYPSESPVRERWTGRPVVPPDEAAAAVGAPRAGYVQTIDATAVLRAAQEHGVRVQVEVGPGDFCVAGAAVARVASGGARVALDADLVDAIRAAVVLGDSRTPYQDVRFVVSQHVDLAARALSPAVNDPLTAMNALDDLSAGLAAVAGRPAPPDTLTDDDGHARVGLRRDDIRSLVEFVTEVLRPSAATHPVVAGHMVEVLRRVGRNAADRGTVDTVLTAAATLVEHVEATAVLPADARRVADQVVRLREELAGAAPGAQVEGRTT